MSANNFYVDIVAYSSFVFVPCVWSVTDMRLGGTVSVTDINYGSAIFYKGPAVVRSGSNNTNVMGTNETTSL